MHFTECINKFYGLLFAARVQYSWFLVYEILYVVNSSNILNAGTQFYSV